MRPIARLTPLLLVPFAAAIASTLAPSAARGDDLPPTVIATLDRAPIPVERFAAALRETGVSLAALDPEDRDRLKREVQIVEQSPPARGARPRHPRARRRRGPRDRQAAPTPRPSSRPCWRARTHGRGVGRLRGT
jgi:hypothetical protein